MDQLGLSMLINTTLELKLIQTIHFLAARTTGTTAVRATTGTTATRATTGQATTGQATTGQATTAQVTTGQATTNRATTAHATTGHVTSTSGQVNSVGTMAPVMISFVIGSLFIGIFVYFRIHRQ